MKNIIPVTALAALVGCASSNNGDQPPSISYDEASAFERSLLDREFVAPKKSETIYTQPINKKEACKLPTSQKQLNRQNFRAYWDGECKNGYAFGLGRDISISDTHHAEEITVHNGSADDWARPMVEYDYGKREVIYAIPGSTYPSVIAFKEKFDNSEDGSLNVIYEIMSIDETGKMLVAQSSAFNSMRFTYNSKTDNSILYKFTDNSLAPVTDFGAANFTMEVIDPKTNNVGFAVARRVDGSVFDFRITNGKKEVVTGPSDYREHLWGKYQEVLTASSKANALLQPAKQLEQEYLFKACNGKSGIKGLDNGTYTKICTWRDQFKESYAAASANYQKKLGDMRAQAATAEQQRQIQQQIALQQQMLQQQQYAAQMAELGRTLDSVNQSISNSMQPTYQFMPMVQPSLSYGSGNTTYRRVGNTVLGSDGSKCQLIGQNAICN